MAKTETTETTETKETAERQQLFNRRISWLLWGGMAALVILLGMAFSRAWQTNLALKAELAMLEPMATAAKLEEEALRAEMAYVQSDAYVEAWSKTHAKMALPGEVLVVSVAATPTPVAAAAPLAAPTPEPTAEPFWSALWHQITGK